MSSPSLAIEESEDRQEVGGLEEDLAELLAECHAFVEATLGRRKGKSRAVQASLLLERLGLYVEWQTVH